MQGAVGYFYYVVAAQGLAKEERIIDYLPKGLAKQSDGTHKPAFVMNMFHQWVRFYNPLELIQTMHSVFIPYHIRTCLLGIVSIFEGYLRNTTDRLVKKGLIPRLPDTYKQRLKWAIDIVLTSNYGDSEMQKRCPKLCLDLDHARRIRNLWMHNNGNFNKRYKRDALAIAGHDAIVVPAFLKFKKSPKSKIAFPIEMALFETISCSHIEALHHINHMLQTQHFGQKRSYGYARENKKIEWERLLTGV